MDFRKIDKYMLQWNLEMHEGSISLYWKDESDKEDQLEGHRLTVKDREEYQILVDMLRNEKPVYFYTDRNVLTTQKEAVGEAE